MGFLFWTSATNIRTIVEWSSSLTIFQSSGIFVCTPLVVFKDWAPNMYFFEFEALLLEKKSLVSSNGSPDGVGGESVPLSTEISYISIKKKHNTHDTISFDVILTCSTSKSYQHFLLLD